MTFDQANQQEHPVETQWHYPILIAQGFQAETKTAPGFVRAYTYAHPNGARVQCVTGYSADHWQASDGQRGIGLSLCEWAANHHAVH